MYWSATANLVSTSQCRFGRVSGGITGRGTVLACSVSPLAIHHLDCPSLWRSSCCGSMAFRGFYWSIAGCTVLAPLKIDSLVVNRSSSQPACAGSGLLRPPGDVLPVPCSNLGTRVMNRVPSTRPATPHQLAEQAQLQLRLPPSFVVAGAQPVRQPLAVPGDGHLSGYREPDAEALEIPGNVHARCRPTDKMPIDQDDPRRRLACNAHICRSE